MALLERVTTLIKANINDLVTKAEHPEKLLRQLLLDMENQFMQVKTQVAIAIADQNLLEKKQKDSLEAQHEWVRKAELALGKGEESLARLALERSLTHETAAHNFSQQIEDQSHQVELLKTALHRLEQKMSETRSEERSPDRASPPGAAGATGGGDRDGRIWQRDGALPGGRRVDEAEAMGLGRMTLSDASPEKKLEELERADRVDKLLAELKTKAS